MKDNYEKHGCEFKNEAECEEELEEEGLSREKTDEEHFQDDEEKE
jgi:hypothetical protein